MTDLLKRALDLTKGYKTYIVALLLAALVAAHSLGYVDAESFDTIRTWLEAAGVATFAAKVNRTNKVFEV